MDFMIRGLELESQIRYQLISKMRIAATGQGRIYPPGTLWYSALSVCSPGLEALYRHDRLA